MTPSLEVHAGRFGRPSLLIAAALAASLIAAGCGRNEVDEEGVDRSAGSALTVASCDPSRITWADTNSTTSVCAGPFEYYPKCYKASPRATGPAGGDSACGIDGYVQTGCYPTCRNPAFGYDTTQFTTTTYTPTVKCSKYQTCEYDMESHRYFCWWDWNCEAPYSCSNAGANIVNGLDPNMPRSAVSYTYSSNPATLPYPRNGPPYVINVACTINVKTPLPAQGSGPVCGAAFTCDDTTQPIYKSCRLPAHGEAPPTDCGSAGGPLYSTPGLTRAGLDTSLGSAISSLGPAPVCVTGESDATSTPAQVQAKHDHLAGRYNAFKVTNPAGVNWPALEVQLVSNLKVLYELYGAQLAPAQQDFTLGLYGSDPTKKYSCSGWASPALPASCPDATQLNGTMDQCVRLDSVATDPTILAKYTDACLSVANQVATLDPACGGAGYRQDYNTATIDLLGKSPQALQVSSSQTLIVADVQTHLSRIQKWYAGYRLQNPASGGDAANALVAANTSAVVGGFWGAVYAKTGLPTAGTVYGSNPGNAPPSALAALFQNGIEADRAVLNAALTNAQGASQPPLTSAPLIVVLGDALQSLNDRFAQVGLFQDLACRFRADSGAAATPSCRNGQVRTEVSELTRLVSTVNAPVALAALLGQPNASSSTFSSAAWRNWRDVFVAWSGDSSVVSAAVLDALPGATVYSPDLLVPSSVSSRAASTMTSGLARVVQTARARISSFDATGVFDSSAVGVLHAGIQQDRVNDVINRAQQRIADLNLQVTSYNQNRLQLANSILAQMTNASQQQNISNQIATRRAQDKQLAADVAGLRTSLEVEEARFGEFLNAYDNLVRFNLDPNTAISHQTLTVTAQPADARWPSPNTAMVPSTQLTSFVKPGGPVLVVQAGDVLHVATTGQWSPTCALSTAPFGSQPPPGATTSQISLANALTGPEGFLLQLNNGQYSAVANSSVHETGSYKTDGSSNKLCGGAFARFDPLSTLTLGIFSLGASVDEQFCKINDWGSNERDAQSSTTSGGSDSRLSANFTTGVRLRSTPFPAFPAGSLLLLEVKHGGVARADLLDVHVVQEPSSAFLIGSYVDAGSTYKDVDLYLAVNDLSCASSDPRSLTLGINRIQPAGAITARLGQGMAKALSNLRAKTPALLEQGRIGPEQMTAVRAVAYEDLRTSCSDTGLNCSLSFYPPEMQAFFGAWVSKELANLERKADLRADQRQLELFALQGKQLSDDLNNAQNAARLLQLMPDWILKDLDSHVLQTSTQNLLNLMIGELYPIIDLKAPQTLASLSIDTFSLAQLVGQQPGLDWTGDLSAWSRVVVTVSNNIVQTVRDTLGNAPPPVDSFIALGFPNPSSTQPITGSWNRVGPERAKAVWDALADPSRAFMSLQVLPTDIWSAVGGTDVLVCSDATPVVTAMDLYMVRPAQFENYDGLVLPMQIDSNLEFPSVAQDKLYRLSNGDWLNQGIQVQSGESTELQAKFSAKVSDSATPLYRVGNGLSPFTKFDIATGGLTTAPYGVTPPAVNATELVVLFRVQSRNVAGLQLTPMCP